jgi:hypothetical protein
MVGRSEDKVVAIKFQFQAIQNGLLCFVAPHSKSRYISPMHFSRHILQSHSTFSLLAALTLRCAR